MVGHVSGAVARRGKSIGSSSGTRLIQARVSNAGISPSSAATTPAIRSAEQAITVAAKPRGAAVSPTGMEPRPLTTTAEFHKFSDLELWHSFQNSGDERAFAELYNRHKADIYTYCLRMMSGDPDKASDIFQEVFIRAFEKSEQFRTGTNVAGWLYMIARNMCLNTHRNVHPVERLDGPDASLASLASTDRSLAPEYDEEQHFLRRKLEEALAQLPLEFREPFMLREFDGFTYREIAAMTGITMGMTKVRIYRAKQRMRELLAPAFSE